MRRWIIAALCVVGFAACGEDAEPVVNDDIWLHMVDGDNGLIFTPIRDDVTNLWSACVDGDFYMVALGPESYLVLSITEDYEHWCPDGMTTDHSPFEEEES